MFGGGAISYKAFGVHGQSQHHRAPGGEMKFRCRYLMLRRLPSASITMVIDLMRLLC